MEVSKSHAVPVQQRLKLLLLGALGGALLAAALVASAAKAAPAATISVAKSSLGQVIVDSRGHTVYLFEKDAKGQSSCYGACAKFWPPVLVKGKPAAGAGAKASLLGVVMRKDGTHQLTYAGHPLYGFFKDRASGQTTGEGLSFFGGGWYVLAPSGRKIDKESPAPASSSSSGGYGYGG
jgi:predicted lipoprotein with Yx(FWY)xxD motif